MNQDSGLDELHSRGEANEAHGIAAENRNAIAIAGFEARITNIEVSAAARIQAAEARITALEARCASAEKETAEVRADLRASQAQLETLRRALRELPPSRAADATPSISSHHVFSPRGLTLVSLPDDVLDNVVKHVAQVGQFDIFLIPRIGELESLKCLSSTSKKIRLHCIPTLMRSFSVRSLQQLLNVATAVFKNGYGRYIRHLTWEPFFFTPLLRPRLDPTPSSIIREILLLLRQKSTYVTSGPLTGSWSLPEHFTSASLDDLLYDDCDETDLEPSVNFCMSPYAYLFLHFAAQVLAAVMRHAPALETLYLSALAVQLLRSVVCAPIVEHRQERLDITIENVHVEGLVQTPFMSMLEGIFKPLPRLQFLNVSGCSSQWPLCASGAVWPQIGYLSVTYREVTGSAEAYMPSDSNGTVSVWAGWQRLCDCIPNLRCLKIADTLNGRYGEEQQAESQMWQPPPPLKVLPSVRFPETLQVLHLEVYKEGWRQGELAAAVSHCRSIRTLYCETPPLDYDFSLAKLPPSLTTIHIYVFHDVVDSTLDSLRDFLQGGHYPETLAEISLEGSLYFLSLTRCSTATRHLLRQHESAATGLIPVVLAVIRLNDVCEERGIALTCDSVLLVSAAFYESLPYLVLCDAVKSSDAGSSGSTEGRDQ